MAEGRPQRWHAWAWAGEDVTALVVSGPTTELPTPTIPPVLQAYDEPLRHVASWDHEPDDDERAVVLDRCRAGADSDDVVAAVLGVGRG